MLLCFAALLFCGCSRQDESRPEKIQIGVTYYSQKDTYLSELLECFRDEVGRAAGGSQETAVIIRDASGFQRTQNDQVKELIDIGCSVLCVNLVDRADPSEIIDLARENGVPIIFFNREPVAEDLMQWEELYYVGADAKQSGIMQGELAADAIRSSAGTDRNGDGKIQYVVLEGEAGHQDAIIRTENAVDTLKSSGIELEKLSYQIANWNRAQAQNRMEQMIGQYGDGIELVLANNDDMALGALDAYEKMGISQEEMPLFFGIDGTDVGLQAVSELQLAGTVYNDKEGQAGAMAELALALATDKGLQEITFDKDRCIYLPYSKVTVDNAEDFMKEETIKER